MSEDSQGDFEITRALGTDDDDDRHRRAPRRGEQIGRYIVIDRLGVGGMGEVLAAYDPELDRRVALKLVVVGSRSRASIARERMLREAQAMARLSHPNVVTVYDAGTHAGGVFIAMEHIDGATLKQWLDERTRPWREVLDVLLHAGQGLAAAHAAGLVHRDFKPANVMVGTDGRVRVLDFGLARPADDALDGEASADGIEDEEALEPDALRTGSRPSAPLTETGLVMGTPAYMAPEQFVRGTIDARTDQFSFCVVAWRGLFGVPPFSGRTFEDIGRTVMSGALREPPKASGVPRGIRDVLRRGLSPDRGERFETMDALLVQLRRAAGGNRRRVGLAAIGVLAALAGGTWLLRSDAAPCEGLQAHLDGVWDDARRGALARAFEATQTVYARDARDEVVRTLDEYADTWLAMRVDSCEATRVHADQTESLMDLRNACLDSRRRELQALVDVFVAADARVVERSVDAAQRLSSIEPCADTERLLADVAPPSDPQVAAEVDDIRGELAQARAHAFAGNVDVALEQIVPLIERARDLQYAPVIAEANIVAGIVHQHRGAAEEAVRVYEDALEAAEQSGHGRAEAEALLGLGAVYGAIGSDPVRALRNVRHGRAVLVRIGEPPELVASAWLYAGNAYTVAHDYDKAEHAFAQALAVVEDLPGAGRLELAALSNLASSRGARGHYSTAATALEEAIALAERRAGEHHPVVASLYNNLGATYARAGRSDDAIAVLSKALAIYDETFGRMHVETARAYQNRGVAWSWKREVEKALADFERARDIKLALLGPDDPMLAGVESNLADLALDLGDPERARRHAQDALRVLGPLLGAEHPQTVYPHVSLADALLALGDVEAARAEIDIALRIAAANELDPFEHARLQFAAARVLWEEGTDRDRARALAEEALVGYQSPERHSVPEIDEIRAWLRRHE